MIREANTSDAARIVRIHLNSWRSTYSKVFPKEVFGKQESEYNTIVENIKNAIRECSSNYALLEEDNMVKAFICYGDARGDKYKGYKEIYSIYIEDNNQKKGYGTKLIKYCFNIFKKDGYKRVIIRCLKENTANEFYQKIGGKVVELEHSNVHGIDITECVYEFILGNKYS